MIWKNSKGKMFQSSIGGTYPVNNGDPQCDYDFDENEETEETEEVEDDEKENG